MGVINWAAAPVLLALLCFGCDGRYLEEERLNDIKDQTVKDEISDPSSLTASFIASNAIMVAWPTDGVTHNLTSKLLLELVQGHEDCSNSYFYMSRTVSLKDESVTFWDVPEGQTEVRVCGRIITAKQTSSWYSVTVSRENRRPPVMTKGPDSLLPEGKVQYILPGDTVDLDIPCEVTGSPTPRINLFKDGRLVEQHSTPKPGIFRVNMRDQDQAEGVYHCEAANKYGVARSGNLTIVKPFFKDTGVRKRIVTLLVDNGSDLTLTCPILYSMPVAVIEWNKDGVAVRLNDRVIQTEDGKLIFTSTETGDSGVYKCHLKNDYLGRGKYTKVYSLTVKAPPVASPKFPRVQELKRLHPKNAVEERYPLEGSTLTIHCVFSGSTQTIWHHDGSPLPQNGYYTLSSANQTLTIESVSEKDRGEFQCVGKNHQNGAEKGMFKILPQASPTWIKTPESLNVSEGETVTFTCEAKGIPQPKVIWYIDGEIWDENVVSEHHVQIEDETSLVFNRVTRNTSCTIQCQAGNDHGSVWADAYINVCDKPQITRAPEDIEIPAHRDSFLFRFDCEATADVTRPLSITWTRDTVPISLDGETVFTDGSKSLHINATANTLESFIGTYACVADDGLSQDVKEARLYLAKVDPAMQTHDDSAKTGNFIIGETLLIVLVAAGMVVVVILALVLVR